MRKEMKKNNKDLELALTQFLKMIYVDFGINKFNSKIKGWYLLSWEEFKKELEREKVKFNQCMLNDWEDFFHFQKNKVLSMMR